MPLSDQDKVSYLANVVFVAFIDNTLSPRESAALEEIRKIIDAKKGQLTSAQKAVESGSYVFAKVGSFAEQVRNLEDMLFVALADSNLAARESELVSNFCQLIGIYQDQLDKLLADTSRRCDRSSGTVTCPACSASAPAQSRFCPGCGKTLEVSDAAAVQVDFEVPSEGYAIQFAESTSGGFATALELAKATGTMQTATKNKKHWYMASFPSSRFADMVPLASALGGLRNRRVLLDSQELAWDEVFGFTWCAAQRTTAYRPAEFCFGKDENRFNAWGCKQSRMDWAEWAQWFSYGRWQKSGVLRDGHVFVFDKERIRHELASNLYRYRFCPYMRPNLADAVLRHLPAQAEVTSTGDWKYNRAYEALPGTIKIVEREGSGDYTFTSEYYSDGVRPRGFAVLADILKKAFAECGVSDITASALLSK